MLVIVATMQTQTNGTHMTPADLITFLPFVVPAALALVFAARFLAR